MAKKKENSIITVEHEYTLTKEDLKNLSNNPTFKVKTQIMVKDKPVIIENRGDLLIKKAEPKTKPKK